MKASVKLSFQRKRQSSPFRRVRTEEVELISCKDGEVLDDRMRVGGAGGVIGWGVRAHEKLKNVKGKRFTVSFFFFLNLQNSQFYLSLSTKRTRRNADRTRVGKSIPALIQLNFLTISGNEHT